MRKYIYAGRNPALYKDPANSFGVLSGGKCGVYEHGRAIIGSVPGLAMLLMHDRRSA
jgi:hypothetical protein